MNDALTFFESRKKSKVKNERKFYFYFSLLYNIYILKSNNIDISGHEVILKIIYQKFTIKIVNFTG